MNKTQFFTYLSNGGKIKMITWHGEDLPADHELSQVRQAEKVQTNAIKFTGGSWLSKDQVKASDVCFVSPGVVSVGWATYQLI